MNNLVIVSVDDWEALYVNGTCVFQGHSIRIYDLKEFVPIGVLKEFSANSDVTSYAEEHGQLPDTLNEVIQMQPDLEAYITPVVETEGSK